MSKPAFKRAKFDENREKPSAHKQWQEHSSKPIATRPITSAEIEEHRRNLVKSYGCFDKEITFVFEKIRDEDDEDRDDCLLLIYKLKCVIASQPTNKIIFVLKIPIPEEVRRRANEQREQRFKARGEMRRPTLLLEASPRVTRPGTVVVPPVIETPPEDICATRPVLKKPVKKHIPNEH